MQLKAFFTSITGLATLLLLLSFVLPWIGVSELTLYGYNIDKFSEVFNDGASYKILFQMNYLLVIVPVLIIILVLVGQVKIVRILALITSLALSPLLLLIYAGKSSEIPLSVGYYLALVGVFIYFLQTFVSFFRKSLFF